MPLFGERGDHWVLWGESENQLSATICKKREDASYMLCPSSPVQGTHPYPKESLQQSGTRKGWGVYKLS